MERFRDVYVQPGDWFGTVREHWLSRSIRRLTQTWGESRSRISHVGVFTEAGLVTEAMAVEAQRSVVRHNPIRSRVGSSEIICIFRYFDLTYPERERIAEKAESYVGRSYGYWKLATHALDWLLGGPYLFRRITDDGRYPICSWVGAFAYEEVLPGVFGMDPRAVQPDDMWDVVVGTPEEWYTVLPPSPVPQRIRKVA